MGLGEILMEEMAYRSGVNGNVVHKFPSLLEYKSPTTKEMCEVETFLPDAKSAAVQVPLGQKYSWIFCGVGAAPLGRF